MGITVFSIDEDNVIKSRFITAKTNYSFAISNLFPLISKLEIQRNVQKPKFYQRLEKDLIIGCIMPPLTLAFIVEEDVAIDTKEDAESYLINNIQNAFVLDGIQRLSAMNRAAKSNHPLDLDRPLFLNILICKSMDNLLYRMITLNNGQKPMTARHQIEVLASTFYEFEELPFAVQTEKDRRRRIIRGSFNKSDIVKAYIAFLSNSTNIDNQKVIADKMDELIADKIMDSDITNDNLEFSNVIKLINRLSGEKYILDWFRTNDNNLIGFSVGIRKSFNIIENEPTDCFKNAIVNFETAFRDLNPAKIKVGQERRKLCEYFISNYENLQGKDEMDLLNEFSQV